MISRDEQPIIAQCTPKGAGAIALIRISGTNSIEITDAISNVARRKKLINQSSHTIHYGSILTENSQPIDQVLFLLMRGPRTFTGQDTVEISCHNNPFIVETIISRAIQAGARLAHNGEFTRRAVLNKKIDLIQAEAVNELIHANTQHTLKQSLAQIQGSFSQWICTTEQKLIRAIALTEASFEFIDEEMEFGNQIKECIRSTLTDIKKMKQSFDQQQQIRQGLRIALIGSVNAGKSSLFNAILGQDRAIVTETAGTTRDVIEASIYQDGNYWTLIDTAGLRKTNDQIEQEGIRRSKEETQKADIILLIIDGSQPLTRQENAIYREIYTLHQRKIIVIQHKSDLPQHKHHFDNSIATTSKNPETIAVIKDAICKKISRLFQSLESPFLLNQRQFNLLLQLEKNLSKIIPLLQKNIPYELVSYHLHDATSELAQLTGKSISEHTMDAVFREFCVGK